MTGNVDALSPPPDSAQTLDALRESGTGFCWLVQAFTQPEESEQLVSPAIRELFLNGYLPYANLCSQRSLSLVYSTTDAATRIISLSRAIQLLVSYLDSHHDALGGELHPAVHKEIKNQLGAIQNQVSNLIYASQSLVNNSTDFHAGINQFIATLNTELQIFDDNGRTYFANLARQFSADCENLNRLQPYMTYWQYCYQVQLLFNRSSMARAEQSLMQDRLFNDLVLNYIRGIINDYASTGMSMATRLGQLSNMWTQLGDRVQQLGEDMTTFSNHVPKKIAVLTRIDLQNLSDDWRTLENMAIQVISSMNEQ